MIVNLGHQQGGVPQRQKPGQSFTECGSDASVSWSLCVGEGQDEWAYMEIAVETTPGTTDHHTDTRCHLHPPGNIGVLNDRNDGQLCGQLQCRASVTTT